MKEYEVWIYDDESGCNVLRQVSEYGFISRLDLRHIYHFAEPVFDLCRTVTVQPFHSPPAIMDIKRNISIGVYCKSHHAVHAAFLCAVNYFSNQRQNIDAQAHKHLLVALLCEHCLAIHSSISFPIFPPLCDFLVPKRGELTGDLTDEDKELVSQEVALMIASIRKRYKLQERLPEQEAQIQPEEVKAEIPTGEAKETLPEPVNEAEKEEKPEEETLPCYPFLNLLSDFSSTLRLPPGL